MSDASPAPATPEAETETVRVLVTETTRVWYDIPVEKGASDRDIRDHVAMLDRQELDQLPHEIEDDGSYWGVDEIQRQG